MAATAVEKGAADAGKGGGKGKMMLTAGGLAVLLGGGGAGAWMLGLVGGGHAAEAPPAAEAAHHETGGGGHGEPPKGAGVAFVDLPDVIVNLQPNGTRMRFLKLKVSLEVGSESEAESIRLLTPRIMDSFQLYLRALSVEEIQGAAGMQRLKEEMLARVHRAVEPQRIADVLFKEMLVQ